MESCVSASESKLSIMHLTDDLEAARHVETLPPSEQWKTYKAGRDRSESASAIPLRAMENYEFRKRLPQLHSSRSADENAGSSTSSGIELTPVSSADSEQAQGAEMNSTIVNTGKERY
jgi:hypothetical protein